MSEPYLITGGAGNLACQLTFVLAARGRRAVLVDCAERPVATTADGCEYVQADVTDRDAMAAVVRRTRPAAIMHFASLLSGSSEADRELAWRVNVDAAFALFEIAKSEGVGRFFFPSSLAVYGGPLPCPLPEDYPEWPVGLYGVTKMTVERLGCYYHERHGLDFRCLRIPVVLSPYAPAGAASAYASRAFVEAVRSGRFTFKVRPQTRPASVYVKDVLRAIVDLVETPADLLTRRVYNIHAFSVSADELAAAIRARISGAAMDFDPDAEVFNLIESWPIEIADASARRDWQWHPQYDLSAVADDFIEEVRRGP